MSEHKQIEHLLVIEDKREKRTIVLGAATCSIGRDISNSIVLDSPSVSRHHALLLRVTQPNKEHHVFRLIDGDWQGKRSANGMRVNSRPCISHDLQHGDEIIFGSDVRARYYATSDRADIRFLTSCQAEEVSGFLSNLSNPLQSLAIAQNDAINANDVALARLASFPELISHPIVEIDLKGNITYLNPVALVNFPTLQEKKLQHPILFEIVSLVSDERDSYWIREVEVDGKTYEQSIHYISAGKLIRSYLTDITKRKQTELALKKSEERWQLALTGTGDGIFDWNILTGEVFMSSRLKENLGYSDEEIPNTSEGWKNLIHQDDLEAVIVKIKSHLERKTPQYIAEYRMRCKDGSYKWILARGQAQWDETGEAIRMVGSHQDISERKWVDALLRKSRDELELRVAQRTAELAAINESLKAEIVERKRVEEDLCLLQSITTAIAEAPNFDAAVAVTLRGVCETIGWNFAEAWIPNSQGKTLQLSNAWYSGKKDMLVFREASQNFSFSRHMGIPGRIWATQKAEWIEDVSEQPLKTFLRADLAKQVGLKAALGIPIVAHEKVIAVCVFYTSIPCKEDRRMVELVKSVVKQLGLFIERKRSEDALRSSMATNRALINAIPDWLFRINRNGIFVNFKSANKYTCSIVPNNSLLGKHVGEIFPAEVAALMLDAVQKALETNEMQLLECQLPSGSELRYYEIRFAVSSDNEVMASARDISDRKQAEEELKRQERLLKAILNNIPDMAWLKDREGRFIAVNEAFCQLVVLDAEDILGKTDFDFYIPEVAQQYREDELEIMQSGQAKCIEDIMLDQKGDPLWIEIIKIPIYNNNEAIGTTGIARNITQRKQVEEDMRKSLEKEKQLNELKSRFVTMTSHEFRTPLATIMSSAELIEHYGHKWNEEKKLHYLSRIQAAVKHMTELMNDVLVLGKAEAGKLEFSPTQLNVEQFCREIVEEIQLSADKHTIFFDSSNPDATALIDEKLMRHILVNLLSNAIKYSPNSDRVDFTFIYQPSEIIFSIRDYGIGIPEAEQERLFESFHRASNVGSISGTGLGLAIVKKAIDVHQGTIDVKSQAGEGTTFIVKIPCL
jgi:PAS domain S-box-containing protein